MATGERPVDEKLAHSEVAYEHPSEHAGQACGDCQHVIETLGEVRCQAVASPIRLVDWCKRFERNK